MQIHTVKMSKHKKNLRLKAVDLGSYLWLTYSFRGSWNQTTTVVVVSVYVLMFMLFRYSQLTADLATYRQEKIQNGKSLGSFYCDQGQKERHTSLKISVVSNLYQKFLSIIDGISKKIHLLDPKLIRSQIKWRTCNNA